jgi:hypothetical protein
MLIIYPILSSRESLMKFLNFDSAHFRVYISGFVKGFLSDFEHNLHFPDCPQCIDAKITPKMDPIFFPIDRKIFTKTGSANIPL